MKNRPRLSNVAKLAGVSTATVSAVVNYQMDRNIRVSPETQARVWKAVEELGYVANPVARSLAGGKNRLLGIFTYEPIFPFKHHDFFYPFLLGIEEEAEAQGYNLLLFTNVTNTDGKRSIFHNETSQLFMADGSILLGLNESKEELTRLQRAGYPFVYVGRRDIPDISILFTAANYLEATRQLTDLMFEQGHRKVSYICLPRRIESNLDRENGFFDAYQQRGYPQPENAVVRITVDQITPSLVKSLLDHGITGAIVEADELAQAILTTLTELGLSVPGDFSIALCGDPHHAWDNSPNWTMFTIPRREMGSYAVRLLVEWLEHPEKTETRSIYLPCTIIPGQTIAAPKTHTTHIKEVNPSST